MNDTEHDRDWYRLQRDEERERILRLAKLVRDGSPLALCKAIDEIERLEHA